MHRLGTDIAFARGPIFSDWRQRFTVRLDLYRLPYRAVDVVSNRRIKNDLVANNVPSQTCALEG
jgi:hypothetical protein